MLKQIGSLLKRIPSGAIAQATLRTSIVLGLRVAVQMLTLLILARLLGAEHFGVFAGMASLAVTLGALTTFGTHLVLLREWSQASTKAQEWLSIALGTSLLAGGMMFTLFIVISLMMLKPHALLLSSLIAIAVSDILLIPLLQLPAVERQAHGHIARSQLILIIPLIMRLLALLLVVAYQPQDMLNTYALAYAIAAAISLPIGWRLMRYPWPHWRTWRLPRLREWQDTGGFAALNLTALGPSELDKTLALYLLPPVAAGTYAAASRVIGPVVLPVIALLLSALPRLFHQKAQDIENPKLQRWMMASALVYGLIMAGLIWMSAPWIADLFGEKYPGLSTTIQWLTLAIPGLAMRYVITNALMVQHSQWHRMGVEISGMVILGVTAWLYSSNHLEMAIPLAWASAEWGMAVIGTLLGKR